MSKAEREVTASSPKYTPHIFAMRTCSNDSLNDCLSMQNLENLVTKLLAGRHIFASLGYRLTHRVPDSERAYIYCAPCLEHVRGALIFCQKSPKSRGVVRIDDRLQASCCSKWEDSLLKLCECLLFVYGVQKKRRAGGKKDEARLLSCLDVSWLEQRILMLTQDPSSSASENMQLYLELAEEDPRCVTLMIWTTPEHCDRLIHNAPVSSDSRGIAVPALYRLFNKPDRKWIARFSRLLA